jgi:hypothetical protein
LNDQLHADFEKLIPKAVWNKIAQFAGAARTNSQNILCQASAPSAAGKAAIITAREAKKPIQVLIFGRLSGTVKYGRNEIYQTLNIIAFLCTAPIEAVHASHGNGQLTAALVQRQRARPRD